MRQLPLSIPEKKFIVKAASELKRLDGRKLEEFRLFSVYFGKEWGSCFVTLGETKVLATVSCEIQEPKTTRPNEGLLFINVDLSPMAAPHFEMGARSALGNHLNRMLEKCLKESKAVDLEALCIVADEKVWVLRVDVNVINHEGNILDCASLAALGALAHFKRPDVTTDGQEIKVHDPSERDPLPTTLHHFPLCVTFALMSESNALLSDPTALEERVADANLVLGVNAYKELCALHLGGTAVMSPKEVLRCAGKAAIRARDVVQRLKDALAKDLEHRLAGTAVGFVECLEMNKITSLSQDRLKIQLGKFRLSQPLKVDYQLGDVVDKKEEEMQEEEEEAEVMDVDSDKSCEIIDLGDHSAQLVTTNHGDRKRKKRKPKDIAFGEGGPSQWTIQVEEAESVNIAPCSSDDEIAVLPVPPKKVENIELSGDSDEEVVHVMDSLDLEAADKVEVTRKEQSKVTPKQQNIKKKKGKRNK